VNVSSERSVSLWMASATVENAPALEKDERADVVVVGAGIAGLTTAYLLARAGRSVIVLDRGAIGGGMTARTSAHLASAWDDFYHDLISMRSLDEARQCYESQAAAIDRIEAIQAKEAIACDFARVDGYLFAAPGSDRSDLDSEIEACHRIGFKDVEWVERAPLRGVDTGRALRFPRQGRFHPLKYLDGLVRCIRRDGGRLFGDTPVIETKEEGGEVTVRNESGHTVRAGAAVFATNSPVNDWLAIHSKQAPYRTYCIAGRVPRGSAADALFWDTHDPYHYVRVQPVDDRHDMLIVGGEDHKTGEADDMEKRLAELRSWTRRHFPDFDKIEHRWSGQVLEPVDYLGFIGRNPGNERIYVATGDSGQGLTQGTVAGILISDLILGRDNPWAQAYDPKRITLGATGRFISENVTVLTNFAEYVTGGEVSSVDEIRPGQGAVLRQGRTKLAAYRDEYGKLHLNSAVCTHTNCIIHWNSFERCWDCPCHGSHFSIDGEPINGPAIYRLNPVEEQKA
jgi:glycine/D-amino acid oxidase-like deaminating enzyme/nitrite reductase/ring-hydroxylating ferredoxin subunit